MKPPSPKRMLLLLESLDWSGHVELGQADMQWLASALAGAMSEDREFCSACGELKEVIVHMPIGSICEECLADASDEAEAIREALGEEG